jgi:hypothetical protein
MENASSNVRDEYRTHKLFAAFLLTGSVPDFRGFILNLELPISDKETTVIVDTITVEDVGFVPTPSISVMGWMRPGSV